MQIQQCAQCGFSSIIKKYRCPQCSGRQFQERRISSKGVVHSYTVIHIAPAEFAHLAPYTVALIQLDDVNLKLTARMTSETAIGDTAELARIEDGAFIYEKC